MLKETCESVAGTLHKSYSAFVGRLKKCFSCLDRTRWKESNLRFCRLLEDCCRRVAGVVQDYSGISGDIAESAQKS